jgi:hypothetical protein
MLANVRGSLDGGIRVQYGFNALLTTPCLAR